MTTLSVPWPTHPNGVTHDAPPAARRADADPIRALPRRLSALAAAALLLAIVGAIVAASLIASRDPGPPVDQPAIVAPASPSPAATPEDATVLRVDIPAAAIPASDDLIAGVSYDVLPPGHTSAFTWSSTTYGQGPRVQFVVSGSFTATVGGPTRLVRADGAIEEIAPDTAVTVSAGEALISRNEYAVTTTNPGAEPTEYLDWGLIDSPGAQYAGRGEEGVEGRDLDVTGTVPEITGSVALTIRRAVLAPDDYVPITGIGLVQEVTGNPEVDVVKRFNDEGIWPIESKGAVTVIYVVTTYAVSD